MSACGSAGLWMFVMALVLAPGVMSAPSRPGGRQMKYQDVHGRVLRLQEGEGGRGVECDVILSRKEEVAPSHILTVQFMDRLLHMCRGYAKNTFNFRAVSIIYPGTVWCGPNNPMEPYDDLGVEVEADMCCRDHDHCDDEIQSGETNHGLTNPSGFIRLHCDCDFAFHHCLSIGGTKVACEIGEVFFNYMKVVCFKEEYPATCVRWGGILGKKCVEYEYDTTQPKKWQFLHTPVFDSASYTCKPRAEP